MIRSLMLSSLVLIGCGGCGALGSLLLHTGTPRQLPCYLFGLSVACCGRVAIGGRRPEGVQSVCLCLLAGRCPGMRSRNAAHGRLEDESIILATRSSRGHARTEKDSYLGNSLRPLGVPGDEARLVPRWRSIGVGVGVGVRHGNNSGVYNVR